MWNELIVPFLLYIITCKTTTTMWPASYRRKNGKRVSFPARTAMTTNKIKLCQINLCLHEISSCFEVRRGTFKKKKSTIDVLYIQILYKGNEVPVFARRNNIKLHATLSCNILANCGIFIHVFQTNCLINWK